MKKGNNKKVLFIAYLFPPVGGGGVQRSSKFVKYLPDFEWNPVVLTVKEPYDFYSDNSLLNDLNKDVKIYRTSSLEPMKWVRKYLKRRWKKHIDAENLEKISHKKTLKPSFLVKLKTYILIPDNEIFWLPFAIRRGFKIIRKEKPSLIYSTASPFTDHLIALILSKFSGLPWVADFRDFWVDRANFPTNRWRLFIDRKLEKYVLNKADHVVTSTSVIAEKFKGIYPDQKYTVITNGYDEDDFRDSEIIIPHESEFRITYTGIFNQFQNPKKIFLALKKIIEEREALRKKLKLKFIGQLDNPGDFENLNLFKELGLDQYSDMIPYKKHKEAISEMCQSTILLLLIGNYPYSEGILTGKLFEYFRSGRPILAVVPTEGLAADLIRLTNSGIVVSNKNVDEIAEGISRLFDLFVERKLEETFKSEGIENYSRKYLTEKLSEVFESVVSLKSNR